MIGVDLIGQIRRAYFEQHRPIKEIVRTLSESRATVRKMIRVQATEFKYERGVQPAPKLGEWVEVLTEILEKEAKLPASHRRASEDARAAGHANQTKRWCSGSRRGDVSPTTIYRRPSS
jgi:hypothetical protein